MKTTEFLSRPSTVTARYVRGRVASRLAVGYFVLVLGVAAFVVADALFVDHPDASIAGVWLFFVTVPASFLTGLVEPLLVSEWLLIGSLILAGALQAWVLWFLVRGRRISDQGNAS